MPAPSCALLPQITPPAKGGPGYQGCPERRCARPIWDCDGGADQTWRREAAGQITLFSGSTQLCLDAWQQGTANGTLLELWTCDGGGNQQWNPRLSRET